MSEHWYAIRTAPQRELAVEAMLRRKGYKVFLPIERKWRRANRFAKGKKIAVTYPMFTRYIFVGGAIPWLDLMAENHVSGVVGFEGRPAPITALEIERIKAMSGAAIPHVHSQNPHRALRTGELAEITAGPFAGQVVKVEGLHGRKARIFLNLFGARKSVEIATENLEAA